MAFALLSACWGMSPHDGSGVPKFVSPCHVIPSARKMAGLMSGRCVGVDVQHPVPSGVALPQRRGGRVVEVVSTPAGSS